MAFVAKFSGKCARCGGRYAAGEVIGGGRGAYLHEKCGGGSASGPRAVPAGDVRVRVTVEKIRYARPDGGFVVAGCRAVSALTNAPVSGGTFTVAGPLGACAPGETLDLTGTWTRDPKFGWQITAATAVPAMGEGSAGAVALLRRVDGIGPTLADRIAAELGGASALCALVDGDPDAARARISTVEGVGEKRAAAVVETLRNAGAARDALAFLADLGLGAGQSGAILAVFSPVAVRAVIEADPYALLDVDGIGFVTADAIGQRMKIKHDDDRRLAAAAAYVLEAAANEGHVWTALTEIGRGDDARAAEETKLTPELLQRGAQRLTWPRERMGRDGSPVTLPPLAEIDDEGRVALASMAHAEREVARHLTRLTIAQLAPIVVEDRHVAGLHENQAAAVRAVAAGAITVVTGGPGVGKTHTTKAILRVLTDAGISVTCVAPTGKAALRMTQLTGHPAATVHRALSWSPLTGSWQHDENNPIGAGAVIADESSMLDVQLAAALFSAIANGARLVLVGDVDQLPSVGPGSVLRDVIASDAASVVRLTHIFRQSSESAIPYVAKAINEGRTPTVDGAGVVHAEVSGDESGPIAAATIAELAEQSAATGIGWQVLSPMRGGPCGVEALNREIKARLNPGDDDEIKIGGYVAHVDDRVIHVKNNYDLEVFNGETGRITVYAKDGLSDAELNGAHCASNRRSSRDATFVAIVTFDDGRRVAYPRDALRQLQLGYAITVHKSQGSSWPRVILAVHPSLTYMLTRALVYTAITRAESEVITVGAETSIARAARNERGTDRRTALTALINDKIAAAHKIASALN